MCSDSVIDPNNPYQPSSNAIEGDALFEYTRKARLQLGADLTQGGMPSGKGGVRQFMDLLNDLDNSTVLQKRLELDEEVASNDDEVARLALGIQDRMEKTAREAIARGITPSQHAPNVNPAMANADVARLPTVITQEGEFSNEVVSDDYDSFMGRLEQS